MLIEYLTGEADGTDEQSTSAKISRLVLAGNSLVPTEETIDTNLEYKSVRLLSIQKIKLSHFGDSGGKFRKLHLRLLTQSSASQLS